jgi:hypothetical protein
MDTEAPQNALVEQPVPGREDQLLSLRTVAPTMVGARAGVGTLAYDPGSFDCQADAHQFLESGMCAPWHTPGSLCKTEA